MTYTKDQHLGARFMDCLFNYNITFACTDDYPGLRTESIAKKITFYATSGIQYHAKF